MNTTKGQTLSGTVKTPATVQQLLGEMLVVILRHTLMIFVVIQHRKKLRHARAANRWIY